MNKLLPNLRQRAGLDLLCQCEASKGHLIGKLGKVALDMLQGILDVL